MKTDCVNKNLFPGQGPDEKIILFVRRHWISFLPTIFLTFLMIVLPLAVIFGVLYVSKIDISSNVVRYAILAASAYVLFILTFFIVSWIDYYFDVLIITDERLVNIEQNGLFSRHISELDLLRVQNVSTSIRGIVPTFFDYGCVVVQTAGENMGSASSITSDFTMGSLPNPNFISQEILRLHQELVKKRGQSEASSLGEGEIHSHPTKNGNDDADKNGGGEKGSSASINEQESEIDKEKPTDKVVDGEIATEKNEGELKEGETVDL